MLCAMQPPRPHKKCPLYAQVTKGTNSNPLARISGAQQPSEIEKQDTLKLPTGQYFINNQVM